MKEEILPLVSILIPVFNRESLISETLESIKIQTYSNWECIIVDDGSTDATVAVISENISNDSRFTLYFRPDTKPKGACSCRNYAREKASGAFVNWFDSDDLMHPDFIKLKADFLVENINYDGVLSKTSFFTTHPNTKTGEEERTRISQNLLEDFITKKISWYMPDGMWRASFLKGKELFDEKLLFGQDRMFHYKLLADTPTLGIINKYLTQYRKHDAAISSTYFSKTHTEKTLSHLKASIALISFLKQHNLLSETIKTHLFQEGIMYLPYCYETHTSILKKYLSSLFVWNIKTMKNTIKVTIAYLSYKISGKGYVFLKL